MCTNGYKDRTEVSFERFSSSDIYIYDHAGGFIECCGCSLINPEDGEMFGFAHLKTPREALAHLDAHELAGDDIGGARRRIEKEYEDLDALIEPYIRPEGAKIWPPARFRDIGNGE